jgi:outer membrane protein TolC
MKLAGAVIGIAACLVAAAGPSFAAGEGAPGKAEAAGPGPSAQAGMSLPALVAQTLTEHEEKLRAEILARVARDEQRAAARKGWRFIRLTDAAMLGLQKNLAIRLAGRQPLLTQEALLEARAVFDPVLQVSVSQSSTDQGGRSMNALINRKLYSQGACQDIPLPPGGSTNGKPDVTQICFAVPGGTQQFMGPVLAAPPTEAHPATNNVTTTTVGITQQLPWGPVLNLVDTSTYNKTYYSIAGQSFSYGAPWSSSLFANLSLPLPGAKGFGPLSPNDYSIKLAQKGNERAFWDVKTAINSILLQIDLAYWNLVVAAENLAVTMENTRLVASLAPGFERLHKQELISQFDKSQMDAELARAGVNEELALNSFYQASTALATLLVDDPRNIADHILFPAGFSAEGQEARKPRLGEIQDTALKHRPELMSRKIDSEANNLTLGFAQNQLRPDVSANVSATLSQDPTVYGYKSLGQSLENLNVPDSRNVSSALTYVYPVGRRAGHAGVSSAGANLAAGEYAARLTANDVIHDVNDAYSAYSSSLTRVQAAQDALKLSELAYQQVEKRFQIGERVSQVELNRNRRDVLSARQFLINARIDVQRASSRLLAAQGIIADRYPGMHAYNDFERHRVAMLGSTKVLRYFSPDPAPQAAEPQ